LQESRISNLESGIWNLRKAELIGNLHNNRALDPLAEHF
jgi:hypothetical protein